MARKEVRSLANKSKTETGILFIPAGDKIESSEINRHVGLKIPRDRISSSENSAALPGLDGMSRITF